MGYHFSDILHMFDKKEFSDMLKTINVLQHTILNVEDKINLDKLEGICKDAVELWGKEG